jgi:hypothetical protein
MKIVNYYPNHDEGVEYPFGSSHDQYQEYPLHQTETDADGNPLEYVVELIMEHRLEPASGRRHIQETLADMDSLALKPSVSLDQPATGTFVDESDGEWSRGKGETRRRRMVWAVWCFGFLAFIVVLTILLVGNRNNDDRGITNVIEQAESGIYVVSTEPTAIATTPTASPTTASPTTASPTRAVEEALEFQTIGPKVEKELLLDASTPQGKAFDAILAEGLTSPSLILQRFALMVIYFSTSGPDWSFIGGWNGFTDKECFWFGIESCSYQQEGGFLAVSNVGLGMFFARLFV